MRTKTVLLLILLSTLSVFNSFAQKIPLVYDVENTGAKYPKPVLPAIADLPKIDPLTDPFEWSDRSGRSTKFSDWSHRRAEIAEEIQYYEIGEKPGRPDTMSAKIIKNELIVTIVKNGHTLVLTSQIIYPSGNGPFPAVIGMGGGSGSLPASMFTSRNIAQISFNYTQVMEHTQARGIEPINKLYPNLIYIGAYDAWSWGVSRLIDGLELVKDSSKIDMKHLAVTGCSFAGKMSLYAGAFDERIALTIAQESGGGGVAAWRVSESLPISVETLSKTNGAWFSTKVTAFNSAVSKLPFDHHELCAMIAPRALLVLGNPDMVWLADESGYVSSMAAREVWKTFGIEDRMGFSIVGGHGHCQLPANQYPEVEAFIDKFLKGDTLANTNVTIAPTYETVDYPRWVEWWGTGEAVFSKRDKGDSKSVWLETECATVGSNWNIINYTLASNKSLVTVKPGMNNDTEAPSDSESAIEFPFSINKDTSYYIFARLFCPSANSDSYWLKMDDGEFYKVSGITTVGLQWVRLSYVNLKAGEHKLTIAISEEGAKLDKLCISDNKFVPTGIGDTAANLCVPKITPTVSVNELSAINGYALGQNYPNPFNGKTNIGFEIPKSSYVSLKVYNMLGNEVAELAGKEFLPGKYTVEFNARELPKGIYFYKLKTDSYSSNRKMILQVE